MFKYYLSLALCLLVTACQPALEKIETTRAVETAVLPTLTAVITTTSTAIPTPTPTALPTIITPTPQSTSTPLLATLSDDVTGWHLYENGFYDYRFSYPPTAAISVEGVTGFPTDELPTEMTADAYLQQLENIFPNDICVNVFYETGFVVFQAPWEEGGKYSGPCPGMGIGAYELITSTQDLTIDDQPYTAQGYVVHEQNEAATWQGEFYSLQLHDGTSITYGNFQGSQGQYATIEGTLRQIVESYHAEVLEGVLTAVYPPISLIESIPFTHTTHSYALQYPVGFYPAQNLGIESATLLATHPNAEDHVAPLTHQDFWIIIIVMDNPDKLTLDQWADWQLLPRGTEKLTVAGVPAWQGSGDLAESGNGHGGFGIATYFTQSARVFTVIGLANAPDALIHYTPIYQSVLDTFRFLPPLTANK